MVSNQDATILPAGGWGVTLTFPVERELLAHVHECIARRST
jgi:hypothetical protein